MPASSSAQLPDDRDWVPFGELLKVMEEKGWALKWPKGDPTILKEGDYKDLRVFFKPGSDELPYLVRVLNCHVDAQDFKRIKESLS